MCVEKTGFPVTYVNQIIDWFCIMENNTIGFFASDRNTCEIYIQSMNILDDTIII